MLFLFGIAITMALIKMLFVSIPGDWRNDNDNYNLNLLRYEF